MMTSSRLFSEIRSLPKRLPLRDLRAAGLRSLLTIFGGAPMITAGRETTTEERGRPGSGFADLPPGLLDEVRARGGSDSRFRRSCRATRLAASRRVPRPLLAERRIEYTFDGSGSTLLGTAELENVTVGSPRVLSTAAISAVGSRTRSDGAGITGVTEGAAGELRGIAPE